MLRDIIVANPDQLALLKQNNPRLAEALTSGNLGWYISYGQQQFMCSFVPYLPSVLTFFSSVFRKV